MTEPNSSSGCESDGKTVGELQHVLMDVDSINDAQEPTTVNLLNCPPTMPDGCDTATGSTFRERYFQSEANQLKDKLLKLALEKVELLELSLKQVEYRKAAMEDDLKQAKQELADLRKEFITKNVPSSDVTTCVEDLRTVPNGNAARSHHEDALLYLFKTITDPRTLVNCRLVCSTWKNVIDNSPEIQRKLTYRITHPVLFCTLDIANRAKSIVFNDMLPTTVQELDALFCEIENCVEKVTLDFHCFAEQDQQKYVFKHVLTSCSKLSELKISSLCYCAHLFQGLSWNEKVCASAKITKFTLNVEPLEHTRGELTDVAEFVLNLCHLKECTYLSDYSDSKIFLRCIIEHLERYPGVLKSFKGHWSNLSSESSPGLELKLLFLAGSLGVYLNNENTQYLHNVNFARILEFEETMALPLNHPKFFEFFTRGTLELTTGQPPPNYQRLRLLKKLNSLEIKLGGIQELNFICSYLHLDFLWLREHPGFQNSPTPIVPAYNLFGTVPSLRELVIHGNILESPDMIPECFRNLVILTLISGFTDQRNIFISLAKLEKLEELNFKDIPTINFDEALTEAVGNKYNSLPVIATFRSLKRLELTGSFLTCRGLTHGLDQNKRLEHLEVWATVGIRRGSRTADYKRITKIGQMTRDFCCKKLRNYQMTFNVVKSTQLSNKKFPGRMESSHGGDMEEAFGGMEGSNDGDMEVWND